MFGSRPSSERSSQVRRTAGRSAQRAFETRHTAGFDQSTQPLRCDPPNASFDTSSYPVRFLPSQAHPERPEREVGKGGASPFRRARVS